MSAPIGSSPALPSSSTAPVARKSCLSRVKEGVAAAVGLVCLGKLGSSILQRYAMKGASSLPHIAGNTSGAVSEGGPPLIGIAALAALPVAALFFYCLARKKTTVTREPSPAAAPVSSNLGEGASSTEREKNEPVSNRPKEKDSTVYRLLGDEEGLVSTEALKGDTQTLQRIIAVLAEVENEEADRESCYSRLCSHPNRRSKKEEALTFEDGVRFSEAVTLMTEVRQISVDQRDRSETRMGVLKGLLAKEKERRRLLVNLDRQAQKIVSGLGRISALNQSDRGDVLAAVATDKLPTRLIEEVTTKGVEQPEEERMPLRGRAIQSEQRERRGIQTNRRAASAAAQEVLFDDLLAQSDGEEGAAAGVDESFGLLGPRRTLSRAFSRTQRSVTGRGGARKEKLIQNMNPAEFEAHIKTLISYEEGMDRRSFVCDQNASVLLGDFLRQHRATIAGNSRFRQIFLKYQNATS